MFYLSKQLSTTYTITRSQLRPSTFYSFQSLSVESQWTYSQQKVTGPLIVVKVSSQQNYDVMLQDTQQLFHPISGQCLDCDPGQREIYMLHCDSSSPTQRWKWGHLNVTIARIEWTASKDSQHFTLTHATLGLHQPIVALLASNRTLCCIRFYASNFTLLLLHA